jgi:hypothetical protein
MSYDAKQMAAVLTTCQACGRGYYMTAPQAVCVLCRRRNDVDGGHLKPSEAGQPGNASVFSSDGVSNAGDGDGEP